MKLSTSRPITKFNIYTPIGCFLKKKASFFLKKALKTSADPFYNIYSYFSLITDSILRDYPLLLIGRKRHYQEYPANIEMIGGKQ